MDRDIPAELVGEGNTSILRQLEIDPKEFQKV